MPVLALPEPHANSPFVVLSDWDGTITSKDSNDYLTDNLGFGYARRRELNHECLSGKSTFRDTFRIMLESVVANGHSFEECKQVLKDNMTLDPGFVTFFRWCKENNVPFIIVSSGMAPLIRAVLENLIGPEEAATIDIIANDVEFTDPEKVGKTWEIVYRHPESGYGHDKSKAILPYRDLPSKPTLFFCGDGVSDMSAAKHADLLFVKSMANGDSDLAVYCKEEGIDHVSFKDFNTVLNRVQQVVKGTKTVGQILSEAAVAERVESVTQADAEATEAI